MRFGLRKTRASKGPNPSATAIAAQAAILFRFIVNLLVSCVGATVIALVMGGVDYGFGWSLSQPLSQHD
jgi:hypothetical protein